MDDKPWDAFDSEDNKPYREEVAYWWHVMEGRAEEALRAVGGGARKAPAEAEPAALALALAAEE